MLEHLEHLFELDSLCRDDVTGTPTRWSRPADDAAAVVSRRLAEAFPAARSAIGVLQVPKDASWRARAKELRPNEGPGEALCTATEVHVATAFAEVLDLDRVGRNDGFFDLGGHPLMAARLIARLEAATGKTLPLRAVFETPTVATLAAALDHAAAEDWTAGPIALADRSKPLPLSFQQERLWFLDRLDRSAGAAYHIEGAVRLEGPLDAAALEVPLGAVVERHEALRTRFASDAEGRPVAEIAPSAGAAGFGLVLEDATGLDAAALAARVAGLLAAPFDLAAGPLFRAQLLSCGAEAHVLVVGGHHAVLDGWSVGLLLKEVSALYAEAVTGVSAELPALAVSYADYAAWQRQVLSGARLAEETRWWAERLAGVPEALALPSDRPRPAVMDYSGDTVPVYVPADVTAGLKRLAAAEGATLFMALSAAFSALLSRLGAGEDVVIGTAEAGRLRAELEPLAGFFVNTLALRHTVDGLASFRVHLAATKSLVLEAFQHQAVPFEAVVEAAAPARSLSHPPLVQVMLVLQNTPDAAAALTLPGVAVAPFGADGRHMPFELGVQLTESGEELVGGIGFQTALFDRSTIALLAERFLDFLKVVVNDPDVYLEDYDGLTSSARRVLFGDDCVQTLPLTVGAQRIFVSNLLKGAERQSTVAEVIAIEGPLDEAAMEVALSQVIEDFDSMRAHISLTPLGPRVGLRSNVEADHVCDLTGREDPDKAIRSVVEETAARGGSCHPAGPLVRRPRAAAGVAADPINARRREGFDRSGQAMRGADGVNANRRPPRRRGELRRSRE